MLTLKNQSISDDNNKLYKNMIYSQDLKKKIIRYVLSKLNRENIDILNNIFSEQINKNNKMDNKNTQGDITIKDYFKYFLFLFDYGDIDKTKFRKDSNIYFIIFHTPLYFNSFLYIFLYLLYFLSIYFIFLYLYLFIYINGGGYNYLCQI